MSYPRNALVPGQRIDGRYRLLKRIGAGALGTVWSARNETTDREVAVKFIEPTWATSNANIDGLLREAKASGKIRHPSVVQLFDIGRTTDGIPFVVMELLEAEKLDDYLARKGALPAGTALRIVAELAGALTAAHEARLFHHRIEPANVLLSRDLRGQIVPKLIDFGIVRLVDGLPPDEGGTRDGALGPVNYLAPEQVDLHGKPDARTDVWSLGVLLHHCLCGEPPYDATTRPELNAQIDAGSGKLLAFEPPIDDKIVHLVTDCLSIDPGLRPTARVVAERADVLLQRLGDGFDTLAHELSPRTDLLPDHDPTPIDGDAKSDDGAKTHGEDAMPLVRPSGRKSLAPEVASSSPVDTDDLAPISKLIAQRLSNAPGELALDVLAELEEELLKKVNESRASAESKAPNERPPANAPSTPPAKSAEQPAPTRNVEAEPPTAPVAQSGVPGAAWLFILLVASAIVLAVLLWNSNEQKSAPTAPPPPAASPSHS